jgi:hypothetical protein
MHNYNDVAVVYLARFGNKERFIRRFLRSIRKHHSGYSYDLVVLLKGYSENQTNKSLNNFIETQSQPVRVIRYCDSKLPLRLFKEVSQSLHYDKYLFLVSWSVILASNWLKHMVSAYDAIPDCGIVAATASYETIPDSNPFPNANVRTTGFLIRKDIFARIDDSFVKQKQDENYLEAGKNSITQQIIGMGLVPVVVDRWGRHWLMNEWQHSHTFRSGLQEGLLIGDKHTHLYDVARPKKRKFTASRAWGNNVEIIYPSLVRRLYKTLAWRL